MSKSDDEREVIASDGSDRVQGQQQDGTPPVRELWRVLIIGLPVMVIAYYMMKWLMRR